MKLVCLLLAPALAAAADTATLAVLNARVWTADARRPWAEAVAASGERILAVGSNGEIRALCSPPTRVIDGAGGMLTPGFIDSHIHLMSYDLSQPLPRLWLRYLDNRDEVARRVAAYAEKLPKGAWILGLGWRDSLWRGQPPSSRWLDTFAPHHPVWLINDDGDAGLANTAALRAAGMAGESTGLIRGGPMWRIEAALVERSRVRDEAALEQVMSSLVRSGVTSVHHNNAWHDFLILRRLHQAGRLRLRVFATPGLPDWRRLRDYIAIYGRGDAWMHWGAVKGYGAITFDMYYPRVSGASQAGLQIMVHTGSNAEMRTLLAVFERVRREQNLADPRFRIEHGHDMPPDAIPRMAKAGALASWQPPLLLHADARTAAGQPAPRNLFPCRALLAAGVKIAFGTDGQGLSFTPPLESLALALGRTAPDGTRIGLDEALRACTRDAAYAEFAEQEKGSLEPGKLADFVLFDRDFSRGGLRDARVRMTVIGGRVAYE